MVPVDSPLASMWRASMGRQSTASRAEVRDFPTEIPSVTARKSCLNLVFEVVSAAVFIASTIGTPAWVKRPSSCTTWRVIAVVIRLLITGIFSTKRSIARRTAGRRTSRRTPKIRPAPAIRIRGR